MRTISGDPHRETVRFTILKLRGERRDQSFTQHPQIPTSKHAPHGTIGLPGGVGGWIRASVSSSVGHWHMISQRNWISLRSEELVGLENSTRTFVIQNLARLISLKSPSLGLPLWRLCLPLNFYILALNVTLTGQFNAWLTGIDDMQTSYFLRASLHEDGYQCHKSGTRAERSLPEDRYKKPTGSMRALGTGEWAAVILRQVAR